MSTPKIKIENLPQTLPLFPLDGVLLLPGGELPLNIFEERYISMINDALRSDRLIGIVQSCDTKSIQTGCVGKISSFTEKEDGRYHINLNGLCRFKIKSEIKGVHAYRRFSVEWDTYLNDLHENETHIDNKQTFFPLLQKYFQKNGMTCNWKAVEQTPDKKLVTVLSMICPFTSEEKQALLEALTPCDRAKTLYTLLEMEAVLDCGAKNDHSNKH